MRQVQVYPEYLNDWEVAKMTGLSRSKLQKDRCSRKGIPYIIVDGCIRYAVEDVRKFMDARRVQTDFF